VKTCLNSSNLTLPSPFVSKTRKAICARVRKHQYSAERAGLRGIAKSGNEGKQTHVKLRSRFLQQLLERNKVLPPHLPDLGPVCNSEEDAILLAADLRKVGFGRNGGNEVDFGEVAVSRWEGQHDDCEGGGMQGGQAGQLTRTSRRKEKDRGGENGLKRGRKRTCRRQWSPS
jgi:hypothetical protein